jgi:hypothetical protein
MFDVYIFAGSTLNYSINVALSNSLTWSVNTQICDLDYNLLIDQNNTNIGICQCNLVPITSNFPNSTNYTLNISANTYQTQNFMANSINPNERVLIIQTIFTSNTGIVQEANDLYLRVRQSVIN